MSTTTPATPAYQKANDSNIIERAKKITAEQLDVKLTGMTGKERFLEDLGADSLDLMELIMAYEEEFDIEISDDDANKMKTVNDLVTYLKKHKP
ncbi:MAG: acyl carrier protein [Methylovulum sp.]|uniref:acyl carrier protein n=1 Tax=Methylovulum sp. TaxID=1916980 RepID=UPI00260521B5|nr:acyl carrier protein [Methylovulum sp.]MDD2725205.1 acyl carrier protein [Methylovulum sp.]MDD5125436.1 acyl carrier protein [Methylovulum sp.]